MSPLSILHGAGHVVGVGVCCGFSIAGGAMASPGVFHSVMGGVSITGVSDAT